MQIYLGIAVTVIALDGLAKRKKFLYLAIIFLLLNIVMGFRGENVGVDTAVSNDFFVRIAEATAPEQYMNIINAAPIYSLYNKALSVLGKSPWILNLSNAVIINTCFLYFIYKYSKNIAFSVYCYVTMYFYLFAFNGTRQMLASAICILAFCLIDENKNKKAYILYLMALGVHITCIVFLPTFFLCSTKWKLGIHQILTLCCIIGGVFIWCLYPVTYKTVLNFFPSYQKYVIWLRDGRFEAQGRNILVTIFYAAFLVCFVAVRWKRKNLNILQYKEEWNLIIPASIGIIIGILFYKNSLISGRMILYYTCFMIILIPNFIECFSKGRAVIYIFTGSCLFFLLYYQLHINYAGVMPYHFCSI